ncbi:hypothetical protein BBJ28_00013163 [Nothophytophthora sp. Chile5]|nr:hypothetical protein BBJ28_00013163 [Nothophytophthora sp. Chile5]
MKARDAAFVVDHRRQLSSGPSAAKKEDASSKKQRAATLHLHQKTALFQQQHASSAAPSPPTGVAAMMLQARKASASAKAPPSTKKSAGAKQLQQSRERERKEKLARSSVQTATAAGDMQQDSVKSRNHKLVLAPSTAASTASYCVSSNFPSWGSRQQRKGETPAIATTATTTAPDSAVTDRLHEEILAYTRYTKATVERMAVHIEEMIANVRESVLTLWPQSKVETFGSYSTGIWLPSSDVDLVILDVVEMNDAKLTVRHLRELAKVLETQPWVDSLLVLDTAKVPVLKLVSAETSVPIDITFESAATHSGLLARDLIKRYADSMPELYPLAIVFKQLLRERDLNDAYTGGLSSYSVVLMIIHFSQLWRNGDRCFEAASIYASGSLPPAPSTLAAKAQQAQKTGRIPVETSPTKAPQPVAAVQKTATPTSSYAAVLARPKAGKQQKAAATDGEEALSSREPTSPPRFSYAAVASGIAKVEKEKSVTNAPPSSYAAAVSAPPGSSSKAKAVPATRSARPLDAISVSSSNADTEDSSSSCSHSSSAPDSDDESGKVVTQQPQEPRVSLGEHTLLLLEFFGIIFDYRKNGLSVRDGGYIYRLAESHRAQLGKPALVIEDPIHPDRNVSASSFAFSKVVAVFEDSYYALKYFRASKFAPSALSCLLSSSGHTSHGKGQTAAAAAAVAA